MSIRKGQSGSATGRYKKLFDVRGPETVPDSLELKRLKLFELGVGDLHIARARQHIHERRIRGAIRPKPFGWFDVLREGRERANDQDDDG